MATEGQEVAGLNPARPTQKAQVKPIWLLSLNAGFDPTKKTNNGGGSGLALDRDPPTDNHRAATSCEQHSDSSRLY